MTRMWTSDDVQMFPDSFTGAPPLAPGAFGAADPADAAPVKPMWQQAQDQIAALQKIDPDFSDVGFLAAAAKTYQGALGAEGASNADALGSAATQHFRDALAQRIADWQSAGMTHHVSDVKLDSPVLFKVSVDGTQQVLMVRFTGTAVRYTADATSNIVTEGSAQSGYFTEFASFVRPAGTTTPKSVAAGAPSHCPGCGAPMQPGAAVCPYCNTPLTGTGSNWQIDKVSASAYT
jgi:predicted lipid-binding transport protein (Tim44 family)